MRVYLIILLHYFNIVIDFILMPSEYIANKLVLFALYNTCKNAYINMHIYSYVYTSSEIGNINILIIFLLE